MGSCSFIQLLILALGCVLNRAQRTPADEWSFPECGTQSCGMVGCREVLIPFSQMDAGYSPLNVICIDKASPDSYLLTRCPDGFYNTFQNTSGVCSITIPGGNGTDLLFRANESATGLHPIDCNFNNSFVYSSVIVANDNTPYRDVQVYINNTWQQYHHNNTNVTVNVGDTLTVVVRGVGNITTINATDPRFLCETNFACNMQLGLSDVSNRGVVCSLHTPAELSDNGRILTVVLDKMDQLNITITVRERSLLPTSLHSVIPIATPSTEHYPQPTSTGATVIIPTSTNIEPTDTISSVVLLSSSVVGTPNTGLPGQGIPTIPPPPPDKGSEGVPAAVIAAIIVAVIGVVVILTVIGIIYYTRKKKRIHTKELHNVAKHVEEATGASPTTSSRSSSVRRGSITSRSMDGPQSDMSSTINERLKDIQDKLEYNIEKTEEVNTGVHALKIDKTTSLKRQTSAS